MKFVVKKLTLFAMILSILISIPVLASSLAETKSLVLDYDDIEQRILADNLQLKSAKTAMHKLSNRISDEDLKDAKNGLYGAAYSLQGGIESLQQIINNTATTNPELVPIVEAVVAIARLTKASLDMSQGSLYSQIESLDASFDSMSDQLDLSKLSYDQAFASLVNTTQNMFVLYHQLDNNLEQLENSRVQLSDQMALINKNIELGLADKLSSIDLETSILELDASYTTLVHQRDSMLLQMKGFIGLTYKDALTIGGMPSVDRGFIDSVEFDKDIENMLKNAMSIQIKGLELRNSSITGNQKKYELQLKENDAVLTFTKKYYTLIETRDSLLVSESKLNAAKLKLEQGQNKYDKGQISESQLKSLKNEVKAQELGVKSGSVSLFSEIENYKAMKEGMI